MSAVNANGDSFYDDINLACERFEAEWQSGGEPKIELFVAQVPEAARLELTRELLKLEIYYRRKRGDTIGADDYKSRFRELADLIDKLLSISQESQIQSGHATFESGVPTGPDLRHQNHENKPVSLKEDANSGNHSGRVLGDYVLIKELGKGGMGVVHLARQRSADRLVALKLIRIDRLEQLPSDKRQEWLDRFSTEGKATARITDAGVVTVYEVGAHVDQPYYSMRYVEGHSLAEVVKAGPLPNRRASALMEQVARAVQSIHDQGVLHRDLKPQNILVDARDRPYVSDFGLAKWLDAAEGVTHTGEVLGSPPYMSPEQATDAAHVSIATDVYGLGATLYALLTGRPPFQGKTVADTLHQVKYRDPVLPRHINPTANRDLETIALKCLEKEPQRRLRNAKAVADELHRYLEGRPILTRPIRPTERLWRWCRRNPAIAGLASAALILIIVAGMVYRGYRVAEEDKQSAEGKVDDLTQQTQTAVEQRKVQEELAQSASHASRAKEYKDDIQRVQKAWLDLDFPRARQLLEAYLPRPGEADYRHWEWYYLQALVAEAAPLAIIGELSKSQTIMKVSWSPNDQFLACVFYINAGISQGIKVWNINQAQEIFSEEASSGSIGELKWSPDGKRIAVTRYFQTADRRGGLSEDHLAVSVYDIPGKQRLRTLIDRKRARILGTIGGISWSSDGKRLAATFPDLKSTGVWEVDSGRELFTLTNNPGNTRQLQWSPDGRTIVTGESDGVVRGWDAQTGHEIFSLPGPGSGMVIETLVWKPDSRELACLYRAEGNGFEKPFVVRVWSITDRQARLNIPGRDPPGLHSFALDWSRDGQRLSLNCNDVLAAYQPIPKLWEAGTGREVALKVLPERIPHRQVLLDPFARRYTDFPLQIRLTESGHVVNDVNGLPTVHGLPARSVVPLAWNNQGDCLVLRGGIYSAREGEGVKCLVWSVRPDARSEKSHALPEVDTFTWSPDSRHFAAGRKTPRDHLGGTDYGAMDLQLGDVDQQRLLKVKATDRTTLGLAPFKPEIPPGFRLFAWSPNGQRLATMSTDRTFTVWDPARSEALFSWTQQRQTISSRGCLAWSPDSRRIATTRLDIIAPGASDRLNGPAREDDVISIRETSTGKELLTIVKKQPLRSSATRETSIMCLAWSPDGNELAAINSDPSDRGIQITIWDAGTGEEHRTILDDSVGPSNQTTRYQLAWRPDGKQIASCVREGRGVRVWDTEKGQAVHTLDMSANATSGSGTGLGTEPDDLFWADRQRLVLRSNDSHGDFYGNQQRYLTVWNTETWDEVLSLKGAEAAFQLSPDKRCAFTGSKVEQLPRDR
jgi:serine/threonine protein kinase/WD40 repeat protein